MGPEVIIPLIISAVSAGASAYNTQRTASAQDAELARGIRGQQEKQRQANAAVQKNVDELASSRSDKYRKESQDSFMQQLARTKKQQEGALTTPAGVGSAQFQRDQAQSMRDVGAYGGQQANLMARMEAPNKQRQDEAFGRGYLGTDIELIKRDAQGQDLLNQMRVRAIRRNPWIDAASQIGMSYAMAGAPGFPGMGGTPSAAMVGSGGLNASNIAPPIQGTPVGNWAPRIWAGP